ncbi:hypothetical protein MINTM001_04200 [Mycobacterium paraintracellulare]|nr:hypothetical protein MINTM001_04200 [Mycobacterium paraintracellulare]
MPFDEETGTIPHTDGRIDGSDNEYVVGWIKRGPTGVIGSNKSDSQHTVDTLAGRVSSSQAWLNCCASVTDDALASQTLPLNVETS